MRVLDLFSGIGGFSLGLAAAGMTTVAFCEINPFCRRVLATHWPGVPAFHDIRSLSADKLAGAGIGVDLIAGGFPCQDISVAGAGAGLAGGRSWLWWEYARLIDEIRPRWAIIENVAALRSRGLDVVLGSLACLGYDAEWHVISAAAVGAPHLRERVWIVAHATGAGPRRDGGGSDQVAVGGGEVVADADSERRHQTRGGEEGRGPCRGGGANRQAAGANAAAVVADATGSGSPNGWRDALGRPQADAEPERCSGGDSHVADANGARLAQRFACIPGGAGPVCRANPQRNDWWAVEPAVGRVAHGIPGRVDRLTALGNAVVPQIVEYLGRAVLAADAEFAEARHAA
jgi:DNA (cytosine-5)-methyltransferase 1